MVALFLLADGLRGVLQHGHVLLDGRQDVLAVSSGAGKIDTTRERERERNQLNIIGEIVQIRL